MVTPSSRYNTLETADVLPQNSRTIVFYSTNEK